MFRQEVALGSLLGDFHIVTSGPVEDLLINVYQSGTPTRIFVDFRANPSRYEDAELREHHRQFVELLEELATADPASRVGSIHETSSRTGERLLREAEEIEYWRRQLDGLPDFLPLPTDRRRPRGCHRRATGSPWWCRGNCTVAWPHWPTPPAPPAARCS